MDCASGDGCNVNIDDIAVAAPGASAAPFLPANPLGGYIRSYDSANGTYTSARPPARAGSPATPAPRTSRRWPPGLLDQSGWYLLDDSKTAVWTSDGWIAGRPAGDVQDGYLFGYGQDYSQALSDLAELTGPATLPDESLFGNWFSQYHPYSTADYQGTILPQFEANGVSLDDLSVDTDWKSPNQWNGWGWNSVAVPRPHRVPGLGRVAGHRRRAQRPPRDRDERPALRPGAERRRQHPDDPVELHQRRLLRDLGLGQRRAGRVLLRHRRPDAELRRDDLARLVLRRQRRVLPARA